MQTIALSHLFLAFIPAVIVVAVLFRWSLNPGRAVYALARMLMQLLCIGYMLTYIFSANHSGIILAVLLVMLLASSWIALGVVEDRRRQLWLTALISISISGVFTLALVTQGVLRLEPWFKPQYMIPLAGMIFAQSMTSVSLAVERLQAEMKHNSYLTARNTAMQAAMIPVVNSLFAVGLVSLPGMMTGQILSGISPLIAARYQIMVMCMIFGAAGISAALFLHLSRRYFDVEVMAAANDNNNNDRDEAT